MGRYLGKCKGVVGVRTRARAALAMACSTSSTSTLPAKKIKKTSATTRRYNVHHDLKNRQRLLLNSEENSASSSPNCRPETITSSSLNHSGDEITSDFPASCCSSNNNETNNDRFEIVADPEVESAQTSSRHLNLHNEERRENQIELTKSENLDSPVSLSDAKSTVQIKMPSESEIDEFFSDAEKNLQKSFADRYNFDVVKDLPLEGRYEWAPVKP